MAGKTMRAVQYEKYGGGAAALKHVEIPVPSPAKNEVLLKVEAVSLNPFDCRVQDGMLRPLFPSKFPCIPATDVAGEIVEVGPHVKGFKVGDKVVCMLSAMAAGGLAEYACSPTDLLVLRPPQLPAAEASGLPIAGVTALQALRAAGFDLKTPQKHSANILITAASGGVGTYAVQLAKLAGLHVTATCGARNIKLVESLGADEVLDYKTPSGASLKSPSGKKYEAVIHCTTGIEWSAFERNLSESGKVFDVVPTVWKKLASLVNKLRFPRKETVQFLMLRSGEDLGVLVGLAREGKLKTVVDSRFPLGKAEVAWEKCGSGHASGKIIVEM